MWCGGSALETEADIRGESRRYTAPGTREDRERFVDELVVGK